MGLNDLQRLARDCVGVDHPSKDIDDWCNKLWGKPLSPSIREKTWDRVQIIKEHLESLEEDARDQRELNRRKLTHVFSNVSSSTTSKHHDTGGNSAPSNQTHQCLSHIAIDQAHPLCEIHTDQSRVQTDVVMSCFVKSNEHPNCKDCSRWKSAIAREQRVHSLETLIIACGTKRIGLSTINKGLVFAHSDDISTVIDTIKKIQDKKKDFRSQISVFACNSDKLMEENAQSI